MLPCCSLSMFFFFFFFHSPAISLGFTTFGWDFCVCDRFFNPTIKVVTFRLCGWCVLGVFLLLAFTRLGHERQDLLSLCDEMHVCTDYTLIRKSFGGNGVWTHVNSKGKIPSTGKCPQRRIEPATLWTASPSTTNWAIPAPLSMSYLQWYFGLPADLTITVICHSVLPMIFWSTSWPYDHCYLPFCTSNDILVYQLTLRSLLSAILYFQWYFGLPADLTITAICHSVLPMIFWSTSWPYDHCYLPFCTSNCPSVVLHSGDVPSPF